MERLLSPGENTARAPLDLALALANVASDAGRLLLEIRDKPGAIRRKPDGSPVTDADERAQALILDRIGAIAPGVAILAEESFAPDAAAPAGGPLLLIDPLDGTKEYLAGRDEFTVNIALVENRTPTLGCVFAPARGALYVAGGGAYAASIRPGARAGLGELSRIATRVPPAEGMTALMSRSHLDERTRAFLADLPIAHRQELGSSLKFCLIAEGLADLYPRLARTMEWDTAAGHAVLSAAGGCVLSPEGAPLLYAKRESGYANEAFIAWGRAPFQSP